MKKLLILFSVLLSIWAWSQKEIPLDSLKLNSAKDLLIDDYGNLYLYSKDFSFTKYDSLGNQKGRMMLTVPYKIQSVQNPLWLPMFSENGQELKFVDLNLNEIQKIDFRQKFGFIKLAFAEDLQQIWLLDESTKRLLQYNYRNDTTINSYPFDLKYEEIIDMLIFESKVYIIAKDKFQVFNFKFEKLFEADLLEGKRLRRENDNILMVSNKTIYQYIPNEGLKIIFNDPDAKIVDKNIQAYFEIKLDKLYLYKIKNTKED